MTNHDTSELPPPINPLTEYVEGLVRGALADFAAGVGPVVKRLVVEALEADARERFGEIRKAASEGAANAVLELVARVEQLEHHRRQTDHACEDCPNRVAL